MRALLFLAVDDVVVSSKLIPFLIDHNPVKPTKGKRSKQQCPEKKRKEEEEEEEA